MTMNEESESDLPEYQLVSLFFEIWSLQPDNVAQNLIFQPQFCHREVDDGDLWFTTSYKCYDVQPTTLEKPNKTQDNNTRICDVYKPVLCS